MNFRNFSAPKQLVLGHKVVIPYCYEAKDFRSRMQGLIGSPPLRVEEGLLIYRCGSIHTFLMRYPIDVCFLNDRFQVVHAISRLMPCRMTRWVLSAHLVLEVPVGWLARTEVLRGAFFSLR